jgi:hypothetical protein
MMRRFRLVPTKKPSNLRITLVVPSTAPAPAPTPAPPEDGPFFIPFVSRGYANPSWENFIVYSDANFDVEPFPISATITHATVYRGGDSDFCDFSAWAQAWVNYVTGVDRTVLPDPLPTHPIDLGTDVAIDEDCTVTFDPTPGHGGIVPLQDIPGFEDIFIDPPEAPSYVAVLTIETDVGTSVWAVGGTQC